MDILNKLFDINDMVILTELANKLFEIESDDEDEDEDDEDDEDDVAYINEKKTEYINRYYKVNNRQFKLNNKRYYIDKYKDSL
jgi:lauroyl/myristoyl acyltransferase